MEDQLIAVLKKTIEAYRYLLCEKTIVFTLTNGKKISGDLKFTNVILDKVWCDNSRIKLSSIKSFSLENV